MAIDVWDPDHPVLQLLRDRRRAGSKPLKHADGAQLGLAIEGGGMRGIVSASMLSALAEFGFADAFDVVYGCSSGAINGAYFLAGEAAWYPVSIYYDDLATRRFINMRSLLVGKPPVDLAYLFDEIIEHVKPLDYERVIKCSIPLQIAITLVDECQALAVSDLRSRQELKDALVASSWLPLGVRGTASFRGQRAIDGAVLAPLPYRMALSDQCTHVLSLSTRPMPARPRGLSMLNRYTARHLNTLRRGLGQAYLSAIEQKRADEMWLRQMRTDPTREPPYVLDLAPLPETPEVKRNELRPQQLIASVRNAYEVMFAALEGRSAAAIRSGQIRAIPRFMIAERSRDDTRIRLIDHRDEQPVQWGPDSSQSLTGSRSSPPGRAADDYPATQV